MKKSIKTLLALGFTAAIAVTTAFSQPVITVDEFGNGDISGTPLAWSTNTADPFSGLITLSYTLPFQGVAGDVFITDISGTVSDILRFDGNFNLFFYSDASIADPSDSFADRVGFPAGPLPVSLFFSETGPEAGPNGLFGYTPGFADPGANTAGASYNFISDPAVPEPSSLALLACGLVIGGFGIWRRKMKKHVTALLALGFIAAITGTTAFSQTNIITVDEKGVGDINGTPLTSGFAVDPFSGLTTLTYTLPFAGVRGDVVLDETPGQHSDLLRFDGNFNLYFFSEADAANPPDAPADFVGALPSFLPVTLIFSETGPEAGPNGLFGYTPGFADPGADSAAVIYNFISDPAVPEPSSLALLVCGLGIGGFGIWRRKAARA